MRKLVIRILRSILCRLEEAERMKRLTEHIRYQIKGDRR